MSIHQSLISPTANPELERALRQRLERRCALAGRLGELEPLAVRLGLIQNTQTPRLRDPTLVLFAADHGLAVDGIALPNGRSIPVEMRGGGGGDTYVTVNVQGNTGEALRDVQANKRKIAQEVAEAISRSGNVRRAIREVGR